MIEAEVFARDVTLDYRNALLANLVKIVTQLRAEAGEGGGGPRKRASQKDP